MSKTPEEVAANRLRCLVRDSKRFDWEGGVVTRGPKVRPKSGEPTIREKLEAEALKAPRVESLIGRVVFFGGGWPDWYSVFPKKWHVALDGYLLCRVGERVYATRPEIREAPPAGRFALCTVCVNRARLFVERGKTKLTVRQT